MESSTAPKKPSASVRLQSLDILRGFVILVMFFVNDIASVTGTPAWIKHIEPSDADGMTFVDIVFPAFLFLVGVSIPFAIGSRLNKGATIGQTVLHILVRTVGLLVIGVFMVNGESIKKDGLIDPSYWGLLTHTGFFLTWLSLPMTGSRTRITALVLRMLGLAILITAALLYRSDGGTGVIQLRPHWWGILGLIGWAYLVSATIYVFLRKNRAGMVGAIGLLYCVAIADAVGGLPGLAWLSEWVSVGTMLGSLAAVTASGAVLGMMLAPGTEAETPRSRIWWAFCYGLGLASAGFLLHTAHELNGVFIYNKNAATVPWCLVSSAVTVWLWMFAYLVGDVRPQRWALLLVRPGQNALLAYVLVALLYFLIESLIAAGMPSWYYDLGDRFPIGLCRAVVFSVGVLCIAGVLQKRGIHLKL
jgi:heparan-alpha-glucosaminide N-acetyltransferase